MLPRLQRLFSYLIALALVATLLPMYPVPVAAQGHPYCSPGQEPEFLFGFAALKFQLGDTMGQPLTCEYTDPVSGDTLVHTTTGLAYYRPSTATSAFTDGYRHWALVDGGLARWEGERSEPPTSAEFEPFWVMNHVPVELWSGPDEQAVSFGRVLAWSFFQVASPQEGPRLYVLNPRSDGYAYIDAAAVGVIPEPTEQQLASLITGPTVTGRPNAPGRIVRGATVRTWPRVDPITASGRTLGHNAAVWVTDAVQGDDGETWYRIGQDQYVHGSAVRLPKPPAQTFPGRWMDADLTTPALLVAYEGNRPVYAALAVTGRIAGLTPTGTFRIQRRVQNETMDSSTIGIPRDGPGGYFLQNVLYTQYFTGDGAAIHYNWWVSDFGYPGSQGCLGLNLADSEWFWNFATIGTPLVIRRT